MKKASVFLLLSITTVSVYSQNVGIGTTSPAVMLDVSANVSHSARFNSVTNAMYITFTENNALRGYMGSYSGAAEDVDIGTGSTNATGKLHFAIQAVPKMTLDNAGNLGIGTTTPGYKLDVVGRMRLQHVGSNTAGIWLDGATLPTRSFIGTINDDHMGIFGNGGVGWNIAMNVENGNTGIGTSTPTAKLDVNGTLRIRSSSPKKGSVLSSDDTNGNASWSDPIAFRASGINSAVMGNTLTENTWIKFYFGTIPDYNSGIAFQPINSNFVAPEDGIYHLNAHLGLTASANSSLIQIVRQRNGVNTIIAHDAMSGGSVQNPPQYTNVLGASDCGISTDVKLLAGDIVWVEILFQSAITVSYFPYSDNGHSTWFSGHLVARQ